MQGFIIPIICQYPGILGTIDPMHHEGHQVTSGRRKEELFMADEKVCIIDLFVPKYYRACQSVNLSNIKSIQSNKLPLSYVKLDDIVVDAMYIQRNKHDAGEGSCLGF
jgi:hypothetical protein